MTAPYRVSLEKIAKIERHLQEIDSADLIAPFVFPWQAPSVPVKKKDGTFRFAVVFRKLNLKPNLKLN